MVFTDIVYNYDTRFNIDEQIIVVNSKSIYLLNKNAVLQKKLSVNTLIEVFLVNGN